jgi:hypothetical protein
MVLVLVQAYIILTGLPIVVKKLWPYILDCTIADKDENGDLTSLKINYVANNDCVFLPGDLILTNT